MHAAQSQYCPTPSPYHGRRFSASMLSKIIDAERHSWNIKVALTHIFLRPDFQLRDSANRRSYLWSTSTANFHTWSKSQGIKIISDVCRGDLPIFSCSDSEVFLNFNCKGNRIDEWYSTGKEVQQFVSSIVPTTRFLIVNTYLTNKDGFCEPCKMNCSIERNLEYLFRQAVKRVPDWQLERLQNFPVLDDENPHGANVLLLNAKLFSPLSALSLEALTWIYITLVYPVLSNF